MTILPPENANAEVKLRPLFELLNKNFMNLVPLEEKFRVDEAMEPYYGGHSCYINSLSEVKPYDGDIRFGLAQQD